MKTSITGHMLVQNEEQWVWYALMSVLPYVDTIIIFDTGSTDQTVSIIKSIASAKIQLKLCGQVTPKRLVQLRNEQLEMTTTDWFLLIDGDEVWPKKTIAELLTVTSQSQKQTEGIVIPALVPLGDLFHFQSEAAGKYTLLGHTGHYNLRAYKKLPDYRWKGIYPLEAYVSKTGIPLQKQDDRLKLLTQPYWHLTHLHRSSCDTHRKLKLEIGEKRNVSLPDIFVQKRSPLVPSPWVRFSPLQKISAALLTPLREMKRTLQKIA